MMKLIPVPVLLGVLVSALTPVSSHADSAADVLKDSVRLTMEHYGALSAVPDEKWAQKAAKQIAALNKSALDVKARFDKLPPLTQADITALNAAHGDAARAATELFLGELANVARKPESVRKFLGDGSTVFAATLGPVLEKLAAVGLVDSFDRVVADTLALVKAMEQAMTSAKDEASAKAAHKQIRALGPRFAAARERARMLSGPQQSELKKQLIAASQALGAEVKRVQADPALSKLLADAIETMSILY